MEITIVIFISLFFTFILCFFAIKKARKLKVLSDEKRNEEISKLNNRTSLAMFFKDILDFFI